MFWYLGLKCSIFELRCSSQWISKFENEKCLCRVPGLMFESTVPHFVLLMDIEIKLHLCGTAHIVSCAGVALEGSKFPFPCSGSAGSFSRIRYWPVSGSPDAGKRQERDGRWGCFLTDWSEKHMCSCCLSVTSVSFFAKTTVNTQLHVRNSSFNTFTKRCMSLLVWFSLGVVVGLLIFMMEEEKNRRRKRGKIQFRKIDADLWACEFIALNLKMILPL